MFSAFAAGDSNRFTVSLADYPASAGWTLHYRLTPRAAGGTAYTFNASASGDDHAVNVAASVTANWLTGDYTVTAWVTHADGSRFSVPSQGGQLTIKPDPSTLAAGTDTRSDAERALAAITAQISGKATSATEMYRVAGRELRTYPLADLLKLQAKYRSEVNAERVAAGLQPLGGSGVRRILVRTP